ncbi:hypothetical protein KSW81_008387 [Nannochloris sp. 'desiccata']|nr:hypothetical protein KSW81_008387 [Chlorella desiccata (nom. nud.)]
MAACKEVIILIIALLAAALPCSAAKGIRGIDPMYKLKYDAPDGKFSCFDGSETIPASHINDAFCDCLDGSDEPGTSACPNGKFYCANIGSEPLRLNSSFVDDAVCDCCDGSDEPQGRCQNHCKEAGAAALAALQAELAAFEAGYNARTRYVKAAEDLRRNWTHRLSEINQEYSTSEIKSNELGAERDHLKKQLDALEAKKTKMEAALTPPSVPSAVNASIEITEDQQDTIAQESAEDIAKRVASQWVPGSSDDKAAAEEQEQEQEPEEDYIEEASSDTDSEFDQGDVYEPSLDALASTAAAYNSDSDDVSAPVQGEESNTSELREFDLGAVGTFKAWIAETLARLLGKPADAAELQRVRATVDAIRSRHDAANNAFEIAAAGVYALKTEREGLEAKMNRSYGPDDVYAQLVDRCVEAHVDKYVYKVCPFHQVEQLEDGHGSRLGSWKGFDDSGEYMLFDNGDVCWQGPNRSMTLRIRCGATETLTKVAEPSRCEYTAEMTTPAACSGDRVTELRAAITAKQALLDVANNGASVKDEL